MFLFVSFFLCFSFFLFLFSSISRFSNFFFSFVFPFFHLRFLPFFFQSSEQTPKPATKRPEVLIAKMTIFLCEHWILGPRWTC